MSVRGFVFTEGRVQATSTRSLPLPVLN